MKSLSILLWTYVVFVLHSALAARLAIGGCSPHLALAGLVLMAVRMGGRQGLLVAAGWGFLSDLLTGDRLGADVACFVAACFIVQCVGARWDLRSPWKVGALSIAVVWCVIAVTLSLRMLPDIHGPGAVALCAFASGSALYSGILVAAVSLLAKAVLRQPSRDAVAPSPSVSNKWRMLTE
jgi:rod shape-determining protein MreD